ncbi:MAG: hypothetical protein J7604_00915 [Sporocytophaga sp.]|uniref:hypothetical protein n=1 Tax=Sporocytophaga sp. TaxID=2231183 RepID=UPI001B0F7F74|nr:hypothetical protein [Sporocytophaga sp.]MBO9698732.1 hypothetical protein [Sporocytophaga sp.]
MNRIKISSLFFLFFILFSSAVLGQYLGLNPLSKPISYKDKTLVVILDESEEYTNDIKEPLNEVLKTDWTLTPYKVISSHELETKIGDYQKNDKYIFLSFEYVKVGTTVGGGLAFGKTVKRNAYLGPEVNAKGKVKKSNFIFVPTSMQEFSLKGGIIKDIYNLQGYLLNGMDDLIAPKQSIREKTIYVNKLHIGSRDEEDIKAKYPYPVKVLSGEEFSKALEEKKSDVLYFDYVDNAKVGYIMIYSLDKNGTILWRQGAKGVNNFVHANFDVLRKKLDKGK